MKKISTKIIFLLLITFTTTIAQDIKESLFKDAKTKLEKAKTESVNLISPSFFADALESFNDAQEDFKDGASLNKIKKQIAKVNTYLDKAFKTSEVGNVTFANTLKARTDALKISSEKNVPKLWIKAEKKFKEAGEDLEDGDVNDAREGAKEAENLFRVAELEAIKVSYLVETRKKINEAEDKDIEDTAPKTLILAKQLTKDTERELNNNRYDTDLPRSMARQAQYEINHAFYLHKTINNFEDKDETLENLILASEKELAKIAATLDVTQSFDNGLSPVADNIVEKVNVLKNNNEMLTQTITSLQGDIEILNGEIKILKNKLSGISAEKSELAKNMERLKMIKQKYKTIESLFSSNEAKVLRKEDDIIIRLIGLSFDVGQAVIKPEDFSLLTRLQETINVFPNSKLAVEGHTDAFGSDKKNMELSQQRADAVTQYLLANMSIDSSNITSIGYGETKPIANNETKEGRAKNRRIDLKIHVN